MYSIGDVLEVRSTEDLEDVRDWKRPERKAFFVLKISTKPIKMWVKLNTGENHIKSGNYTGHVYMVSKTMRTFLKRICELVLPIVRPVWVRPVKER